VKIKLNPLDFCRCERLYYFCWLTLSAEVNFIPERGKKFRSNTEEKSCNMQGEKKKSYMPLRSSVPSSSSLNPLFLYTRLPSKYKKLKTLLVLQSPFKGCWELERSTRLLV